MSESRSELEKALENTPGLRLLTSDEFRQGLLADGVDPAEVELLVAMSEGDPVANARVLRDAQSEDLYGHLPHFQRRPGALRKTMQGNVVFIERPGPKQ